MRPGFTLYSRILFWFLLSIAVLLLLVVGVFDFQFRLSPFSPLRSVSAEGLDSVARLIEQDLDDGGPSSWDAVLSRRSAAYGVEFTLVSDAGSRLAGQPADVPEALLRGVARPGGRPGRGGPPPDASSGRRPPGGGFVVKTEDPVRYWGAVPVMLGGIGDGRPTPAVLVAISDRRDGHGLFFDARPWLLAGAAVLIVSIIVWVPLVRNLANPIARMTSITEQIARGRFDVRLETNRSDEIGRLAAAINDMAGRLGRLVRGQKRFLADVAHELSSPIARLELGLGILEQDGECSEQTIEDIRDDVRHMAELVRELLLYVQAEQDPSRATLEPTALRTIVDRALRRECGDGALVRTEVDAAAVAMANPALLTRALANLLRNAMRYASGSSITVRVSKQGRRVVLEVRDEGPGVPDQTLGQLFDPFYRPDDSRVAETGGVGLGLAIVRTCVEACKGRVSARNVQPHGLSVVIELDASREGDSP